MQNTIFALATGNQVAALSVIRVSGKDSERILKKLTLKNTPKERVLSLRNFYFPKSNKKSFQVEQDLEMFAFVFSVGNPASLSYLRL